MYAVYTTDEFDKRFNKLDNEFQRQIEKELEQLQDNPYAGKPLRYNFFREKRVKNYRIYYLIYEEHVVVFVITVSNKKNQQRDIDSIINLIPYYKEQIRKKLNL